MQLLGLKQDCELFEIESTYEERSVTVFSTFLTRTFWQTCSSFTAKDVLRGEVKVVNLLCVAGGFQRGARPWTSGAAARGMGKKCALCNYPFPRVQIEGKARRDASGRNSDGVGLGVRGFFLSPSSSPPYFFSRSLNSRRTPLSERLEQAIHSTTKPLATQASKDQD